MVERLELSSAEQSLTLWHAETVVLNFAPHANEMK